MVDLSYAAARYWYLSELRRLKRELRNDNAMRIARNRQMVICQMIQLRRAHRLHANMRIASETMVPLRT